MRGGIDVGQSPSINVNQQTGTTVHQLYWYHENKKESQSRVEKDFEKKQTTSLSKEERLNMLVVLIIQCSVSFIRERTGVLSIVSNRQISPLVR